MDFGVLAGLKGYGIMSKTLENQRFRGEPREPKTLDARKVVYLPGCPAGHRRLN
ncbi:hypothetical protein CPB83DRAFT_609433 [Crepidotus variabilis]|uniref:Uncharacterized protein n=1 Tax=Crepidotus variabilis TaxID=179855 RepID=A0A9P6JKQ5_9AGAR|nr:hypothetical protein CPB83DRAFT_609433 [Crepidotus variabilis]